MPGLFDTDDAAPELPTAATVRALADEFGYNPAAVRKWTRQRAETVLGTRRTEARRDRNHATAAATGQEPDAPRPEYVLILARVCAAEYLEQELAAPTEEGLVLALTHAMYPFVTDELKQFAHLVAQQLRRHPDTGALLAPEPEARTCRS